jgi:hypothetical protein
MVPRWLLAVIASALTLSSPCLAAPPESDQLAAKYFGHINTACHDSASCTALTDLLKRIDTDVECAKIGHHCVPAIEFLSDIFGATFHPTLPDYLVYLEQEPWDIISGRLDFYDRPPGGPAFPVLDQRDPDATTFLAAHTEYWRNTLLFAWLHAMA